MLHRIFLTALLAGALAGVSMFVAHMMMTTPLIIQAEAYETTGATHSHESNATPESMAAHGETSPDAHAWAPGAGLERNAYTLVADLLMSIGFAFLLVGAIALSGQDVDLKRGLIWGLCGFAALSVGPALGLAPELPGMQSPDLQARQIWWVATALATAAGLALIFFTDPQPLKIVAAILIVLPHLIGAPENDVYSGELPAVLASRFAVASLVVNGLFWLVLGGSAGYFYRRFEKL